MIRIGLISLMLLLTLTMVAQQLQVRGEMIDIGKVSEGEPLYLKNKILTFGDTVPLSLQGWGYLRTMYGCRPTIQVRSNGGETIVKLAIHHIADEVDGWKKTDDCIKAGGKILNLYQKTVGKEWEEMPLFANSVVMLFAQEIKRADFSPPPGLPILQSPSAKKHFLTDPALVILPDGSYVAGGKCRFDGRQSVVRLVRSTDKGLSWQPLSDLADVGFYNLFVHKDDLYLMGTKGGMNELIIRRSTDGGQTWSNPYNNRSGLLSGESKSYHSASVPTVVVNGRIWRAFEDNIPNGKRAFRAFVMSAPVDSDLLDSASWQRTTPLPYSQSWLSGGRRFKEWLEGNAVVARDGGVVNILRVGEEGYDGKAALVHICRDGRESRFDPEKDIIDFPGGGKKFVIRFDSVSNLYWAITNHPADQDRGLEHCGLLRNHVVLTSSKDLRQWTICDTLISHPDPHFHGYQYIDWTIDGNDIIAVSRTAHDDADGMPVRQHDANYLTFHRFKNFRKP